MGGSADNGDRDWWAALRWDDLEQWVGARVLGRGRNYHKQGRILAVARRSDGTLLGRVVGGALYTTRVTRPAGSAPAILSSNCSCPYGSDCKHAVALVLEYLDRLESGREVPEELPDAPAGDPGAQYDEDSVFLTDDEFGASEEEVGERTDAPTTGEYLNGLSKDELIDLVEDLAAASEEGSRLLETRTRISQGDAASIARAARAELRRVAAEPGWRNNWTGEGHTPDYSHVTAHLASLLAAGEADLVLELGREILKTGTDHVEQSDDEGDTACEVAESLGPVWQAVNRSSLSPAERTLWLIDRILEDEYELCGTCPEVDAWEADATAWSEVADAILTRLDEDDIDEQAEDREWVANYARDSLTRWAVEALDRAGREDEATALCVREAPLTHSYQRAVERLLAAERFEEAQRLALEGIARTEDRWAGIASTLRESLREIATHDGDAGRAAAFVADGFFFSPSLERYRQLREAAEQAEAWPAVRQAVLDALTTGAVPDPEQGWPLPDTGAPSVEGHLAQQAPWPELLTEIALEEGDHDRALEWYRELMREGPRWGLAAISERVAAEVATTHPDRAIEIWQQFAAEAIDRKNRGAYEEALRYLRPIRDLLTKLGRRDEWESCLADLRATYPRRRALLETLGRLDERPIIGE